MTVEAIKDAIEHLPAEEQSALVSWIGHRDLRAWDKQIEADFSPGGAGLKLLEAIDAEIDAGRLEHFQVIKARE